MKDLQELLRRTSENFAKRKQSYFDSYDKIKKLQSFEDLIALNGEEVLRRKVGHIPKGARKDQAFLERIIGINNLMDINYFSRGLEVAKTVGRIVYPHRNHIKGIGTGFLVAPNMLMTNNHVIEDKYMAQSYMVEFEFEKNDKGIIGETALFQFEPSTFFITNEDLDYTIVAVEPIAQNNPKKKLEDYGYNILSSIRSRFVKGEHVSIIQHPKGLPKMIAFRENVIVDFDFPFIHYNTDTEKGSSGSMVINDQWEIVALHSSGVPKRDDYGNVLSRKNKVVTDLSNDDLIHWVANQGISIDAILDDLSRRRIAKDYKVHREEILKNYQSEQEEYQLPEKEIV